MRYKVWIHIEGLDRNGDQVEGDEVFEPIEVACFDSANAAESFRDDLIDLIEQAAETGLGLS